MRNVPKVYDKMFPRYLHKKQKELISDGKEYKIQGCKHRGSYCLITYMQFYSDQNYCQKCAVELGKIKHEKEHFLRNYVGRYREGMCGNPKGKPKGIKWTILDRLNFTPPNKGKHLKKHATRKKQILRVFI